MYGRASSIQRGDKSVAKFRTDDPILNLLPSKPGRERSKHENKKKRLPRYRRYGWVRAELVDLSCNLSLSDLISLIQSAGRDGAGFVEKAQTLV